MTVGLAASPAAQAPPARARPAAGGSGGTTAERRRGRSSPRRSGGRRPGPEDLRGRMRHLPRPQRARHRTRRQPGPVADRAARSLRQLDRTAPEEGASDADERAEQQPHRRADHRSLAFHLAAHQRHAARLAGVRAGDVLVGDAKAGEAYFNGEGRCATCHSPTGDLAGYGKRFPPIEIQQRFVFPNTAGGRGRGRAAGPSRQQVTVTVTLPDGTSVVRTARQHGRLPRRAAGHAPATYRSWTRTPAMKVVKNDPLRRARRAARSPDRQAMHDVVAYLGDV